MTFLLNFLLYALFFFLGSVAALFAARSLYPATTETEAFEELDGTLTKNGSAR